MNIYPYVKKIPHFATIVTLSRRDTSLLKGVAILAIVLHNFCHWIPGVAEENEYNFYIENTHRLIDTIASGGPYLLMNLFSFFGCYGVSVFLFISGYGLVCKYEQTTDKLLPPVTIRHFVSYNALKLWKLMIPGVILLFVYETFFTSGWRHGVDNVVYMLTFVVNFLPQTNKTLLPQQDLLLGPWWYFSLTMQMYLLYRLAYYRRNTKVILASILACITLQVLSITIFLSPQQHLLHYLRYTFAGCLLPFALGVWTARHMPQINTYIYVAAWAIFVGGCFNIYLWMLSQAVVPILVYPLVRIKTNAVRKPLEWMGKISAALFVIHPIVRCFINPRRDGDFHVLLLEYLFISVLAAWGLSLLLKRIPIMRKQ